MKGPEQSGEVVEVEVERLPYDGERPVQDRHDLGNRFRKAFGPALAGLAVDLVDFATFSPILGLLLGALLGSQLVRYLDVPWRSRLALILACGVYCAVPGTNRLPIATCVGAFARMLWPERREAP